MRLQIQRTRFLSAPQLALLEEPQDLFRKRTLERLVQASRALQLLNRIPQVGKRDR
jgi:hypothetical protein